MRPKIVITVVTLGLFIFGTLFAIRQSADRSTRISEPQTTASSTPQSGNTVAIEKVQPVPDAAAAAPKTRTQPEAQPATEDARQAYVEKRSAELMDIAMTDDRTNLDTILSELSNRDPEIRKAALEAAIQFGSRDAIPKLADAISQTDDPSEKAALADAIEFLKLPSLTEIRAQSSAQANGNSAATAAKPGRKGTLARRVQSAPPPNQ
jgi:HEAT repeat protein